MRVLHLANRYVAIDIYIQPGFFLYTSGLRKIISLVRWFIHSYHLFLFVFCFYFFLISKLHMSTM